jgi:hypothetical protein
MSKKQDHREHRDHRDHRHSSRYEEESEESNTSNLDSLDAYIEASEMYLEALKLSDAKGADAGYVVGMTAVYFGKAFLAFTNTDNVEAMKGSLREAINAYSAAMAFCESNGLAKQFVYTSHLIVESLRTESQNY